MSKGKKIIKIFESVFCVVYLLFALIAGIIFLINCSEKLFLFYGVMTLTLFIGDSFHLIPRIINNIKGETEKTKWWMNLGLLVSSITMTIFYILLFYIWKELNPTVNFIDLIPISIWITAIARIIICLFPQNNWFNGGNIKMSVIRNLIFCATGFISMLLFLIQGLWFGKTMAICILLSFVFYMPVALFGKENPKLGMLMMPKTIMYIIMISLGLSLIWR